MDARRNSRVEVARLRNFGWNVLIVESTVAVEKKQEEPEVD